MLKTDNMWFALHFTEIYLVIVTKIHDHIPQDFLVNAWDSNKNSSHTYTRIRISKHPVVGLILIIYYAYDIHWYNAYQKQQKELLSGFVLMFLFTELIVKTYCFFALFMKQAFKAINVPIDISLRKKVPYCTLYTSNITWNISSISGEKIYLNVFSILSYHR